MKKIVIILFVLFAFLSILSFFPEKPTLTGSAVGAISLFILTPLDYIDVDSPRNITYNFEIGQPIWIDLNVSTSVHTDETWSYSLFDTRHNISVASDIFFTPNITISAVRWGNQISVRANTSNGASANRTVNFFVSVPNSAPILSGINDSILVCEDSQLNYSFNVNDIDEDISSMSILPSDPFFVSDLAMSNYTAGVANIYSGILTKNDVGNYSEAISASDGEYADTKYTNISVIEINHAPSITPVGAQTIYSSGDNSTLYKEINVVDTESGNQSSGNFTFSLAFLFGERIFDISSAGVINFTGNSSSVGVYGLRVCATDNGLRNVHPNISICGQDGLNMTSCSNFSLTITNSNRAPVISSYLPTNLSLSSSCSNTLSFNVSMSDADGTSPDVYWYVDNNLKLYNAGMTSSFSNFSYTFDCTTTQGYLIRAVVSDGLENASVSWMVNAQGTSSGTTTVVTGGGGGGGGSSITCSPLWGCNDWQKCISLSDLDQIGILFAEDRSYVEKNCSILELNGSSCGFQIRSCNDVNLCHSTLNKPRVLQACYYTPFPSCSDGIKNCHDDSCEILVDCGGPCSACPSCSDGKQNQGEFGVDCGGPCPTQCAAESPSIRGLDNRMIIVLSVLVIALVAMLTVFIMRLIKLRKRFNRKR